MVFWTAFRRVYYKCRPNLTKFHRHNLKLVMGHIPATIQNHSNWIYENESALCAVGSLDTWTRGDDQFVSSVCSFDTHRWFGHVTQLLIAHALKGHWSGWNFVKWDWRFSIRLCRFKVPRRRMNKIISVIRLVCSSSAKWHCRSR